MGFTTLFAGTHPPATRYYDQPKQQQWADKIAQAQAFILLALNIIMATAPHSKMPWTMSAKNGKAKAADFYRLWFNQWLTLN